MLLAAGVTDGGVFMLQKSVAPESEVLPAPRSARTVSVPDCSSGKRTHRMSCKTSGTCSRPVVYNQRVSQVVKLQRQRWRKDESQRA